MDIQIRKMEERDIPTIYEYIHKKYVKKYYKEEEEKQWQAHQSWYRFVLHSNAYFFYIIEQEEEFVGTVRYELEEEKAIVSIFIREDYRKQGYAKKVLLSSISLLLSEVTVEGIFAHILKENEYSQRLFLNCGFQKYKREMYWKKVKARED
ncbi:MAG: GNAT family N-acetyltransferase [Fusobacterium necrophorum]|nr:GNAT family N-acetyltransferase [Fusobacterium necrophorum]